MVRYLLAAAAVAGLLSASAVAQAEDFDHAGTTKIITRTHDGMGGKKVIIKRHGDGMVSKKIIRHREGFFGGSRRPDRVIIKRHSFDRY